MNADRWMRFITAADERGGWEMYARRLLAPIIAGVVGGLLFLVVLLQFRPQARYVAIIAVAVLGVVWAIYEMIWLARENARMRKTLAQLEELYERERERVEKRGHEGER